MSFQYLQLEQRDQVATVWINRAEMQNAFNTQVIEELHRCFSELNTRDDVRVVILAGRGKSFSAGADLNWMKEAGQASQAENEADALKLAKMLQSLATLKQPTIARVQGIALLRFYSLRVTARDRYLKKRYYNPVPLHLYRAHR